MLAISGALVRGRCCCHQYVPALRISLQLSNSTYQNPKPQVQYGGVLAIAGALDGAQKPVLLASHNEDRVVRLWELPTFSERGELSAVSLHSHIGVSPP